MNNILKNLSRIVSRLCPVSLLWVIATLLLLVSCRGSTPQPTPASGMIATFLVDPGGPRLPSIIWSPSGDMLAISVNDPENPLNEIYIYDLQTNQLQLLMDASTGIFEMEGQAWSPDGKQIVFLSDGGYQYKAGFWIQEVNGSIPPQFLTEGNQLIWSPKGGMAISRKDYVNGIITIHIRDPQTGKERLIFSKRGNYIGGMSWSPDGEFIVITMEENYDDIGGDIYVINVKSKEQVKLTTDNANLSSAWSPTGDIIAYTKRIFDTSPPTRKLYIMRSDGSCSFEVQGVEDIYNPEWSSSGSQIAFVNWDGIYLLDLIDIFGEEFQADNFPCNLSK